LVRQVGLLKKHLACVFSSAETRGNTRIT